jgi:hypothetical protein
VGKYDPFVLAAPVANRGFRSHLGFEGVTDQLVKMHPTPASELIGGDATAERETAEASAKCRSASK